MAIVGEITVIAQASVQCEGTSSLTLSSFVAVVLIRSYLCYLLLCLSQQILVSIDTVLKNIVFSPGDPAAKPDQIHQHTLSGTLRSADANTYGPLPPSPLPPGLTVASVGRPHVSKDT